jgi:hypothetical protein
MASGQASWMVVKGLQCQAQSLPVTSYRRNSGRQKTYTAFVHINSMFEAVYSSHTHQLLHDW